MALKLKQRVTVASGGAVVMIIILMQLHYSASPVTLSQWKPRIQSARVHELSVPKSDHDEILNSQVHLPVMRRELDLSAYTSLEADAKNLTDSKLLELVLRSKDFQKPDALGGFIRIAHLLESYQNKHRANSTSDTSKRNSADEQQMAASAEGDNRSRVLDPNVIDRLSNIATRMAQSPLGRSHRKSKKRRGPQLNVYDKDSPG